MFDSALTIRQVISSFTTEYTDIADISLDYVYAMIAAAMTKYTRSRIAGFLLEKENKESFCYFFFE